MKKLLFPSIIAFLLFSCNQTTNTANDTEITDVIPEKETVVEEVEEPTTGFLMENNINDNEPNYIKINYSGPEYNGELINLTDVTDSRFKNSHNINTKFTRISMANVESKQLMTLVFVTEEKDSIRLDNRVYEASIMPYFNYDADNGKYGISAVANRAESWIIIDEFKENGRVTGRFEGNFTLEDKDNDNADKGVHHLKGEFSIWCEFTDSKI